MAKPMTQPLEANEVAAFTSSASCPLMVEKVRTALLEKDAGQLVVYLLQMISVSAAMSQSVAVTVSQGAAAEESGGGGETVVVVHTDSVGLHTLRTLVLVHDDPGHHTDDHSHSSWP